jgi:hypothetical protein
MMCDELNNLVHADVPGTSNTSVKTHEQLKKLNILCGPFSKQQISLQHSLLKGLESALVAWFKYAYTYNACVYEILLILLKTWAHYTLSKY